MPINITKVLKHSAKFNAVQIIANAISIPKNIIIASILLPENYGVISFLGLWSIYSSLINPGILSAGCREIPYFLGRKEKNKALRVQNISITGDLLYCLFPFLVVLFSSFFFSNPIVKTGLIVTAFSFIITHFVNYWRSINFIRQNFTLVAKGDLISAVSTVVCVSALIYWLRIYAVLIAPIIVSFILGTYYWRKGSIGYHFQFDLNEIKRLAKVGIPLALGTLAFWGYKMADRTIIASKLPLRDLGLYMYAMTFIMMGWNIFADFGRVLKPIVYEDSGRSRNGTIMEFSDIKRIAIYLAIVTAIAIPLSQLGFYLLVNLITTKYIGSISIFYVLSCNLYLSSITIIPGIILKSKVINKQTIGAIVSYIWLGLNIGLDLLVIHLGYGILGVAWVTVGTQGMSVFISYYFTKKYAFPHIKGFFSFVLSIVFPFLIAIFFSIFHNLLNCKISNPYVFASISLPAQVGIWTLIICIFYHKYFSKEKFLRLAKELKVF